MATPNVFQQFLDDTLSAAGFADAPEVTKKSFRDRMEVAFAKRLGLEAVNLLGAEDLQEFEKWIVDNPQPDPNNLYKFFADRVPNFETKILDVLKQFQVEFLQAASTVT